jgi:tripartite-type tricarboxylate transporter receptor subunit TctC
MRNLFKTASTLAMAAAMALTSWSAMAEYPEKPITMIIPLGAGGSHDLNARVISSILPSYLGQPVIVKLMPGAGGQTGTAAAAKAASDGYTLLFTHNYIDQLQQHVAKLPYDPTKDFVTVARTNYASPTLIVKDDSKFKTFEEVVEFGKANPGKLTFGHSGNWGAFMVPGAMLFSAAGVNPRLIPHKGGGPAMQALLAGNVDVSMGFNSSISGQEGKVRPLISVSNEPVLDGVPTVADKGIDGVANSGTMHRVVLVNRDVPADVLAKLRKAFADMQADKTYNNLLKKLGENAAFMTGEDYEEVRKEQSAKYKAFAESLAK